MEKIENSLLSCPWQQEYSNSAYASDAVVRFLVDKQGFSSPFIRSLFQVRSGFAFSRQQDEDEQDIDENAKLIGALLHKLSHRGIPAPCSLKVERYVLNAAKDAGILDFEETINSGKFEFNICTRNICKRKLKYLQWMLAACCLPELLVDDEIFDSLLQSYRSLCTELEKIFFDKLVSQLTEKRLALFVYPQMRMSSMLHLDKDSLVNSAARVDFAVVIPFFRQGLKIVMEVDEPIWNKKARHHNDPNEKARDEERDKLLKDSGWKIHRFPLEHKSTWMNQIKYIVSEIKLYATDDLIEAAEQLRHFDPKLRKAIQSLILLPLAEGQLTSALSKIIYKGEIAEILISDVQNLGLDVVVDAVTENLENISGLHDIDMSDRLRLSHDKLENPDLVYFAIPSVLAWECIESKTSIVIAPATAVNLNKEPLLVANPKPINIKSGLSTLAEDADIETIESNLKYLLQNVFRLLDFRDLQIDIIKQAISLRPVVGLLPTGAGKSLCYQLASFTQPGITMVVDPLVSLMVDQQQSLEAKGIHRCIHIRFGKGSNEIENLQLREKDCRTLQIGYPIFVFVAPERLQMKSFKKCLSASHAIPYCVVDEAHCVSEWGHDFRPSYLNVGRRVRKYCSISGVEPSFIALTGTASRNVLIDIMKELGIDDQEAVKEPDSFDRPNLNFEIYKISKGKRINDLSKNIQSIISEFGRPPAESAKIPSGLVFTNFCRGDDVGVEILRESIIKELKSLNITEIESLIQVYCGNPPKKNTTRQDKLEWNEIKSKTQKDFKDDKIPILVCTHSFGMGIDKPNIRFTVHSMLPRSIEDFYQQCGRAGRDGRGSRCILYFADDDSQLSNELMNTEQTKLEEIGEIINEEFGRNLSSQDDAIRNTYFLRSNFLGRDKEKEILRSVITNYFIPNLDKSEFNIPFRAIIDTINNHNFEINSKLSPHTMRLRLRAKSHFCCQNYGLEICENYPVLRPLRSKWRSTKFSRIPNL